VKEGRGGIREVELFVQVFQLIYGGDRLALRTGRTLTALEQLGTQGFIETDVQRDLEAAYIFFRNVEHGLQAAEGQQTHSLSGTERGVRALARRLGFDEPETLTAALNRHRERVHAVYARLFEGRAEDEGLASREIFRLLADDGADDDVRARLVAAGFGEPDRTLDAMRALGATCGQGRSSTRNLLANLLATIVAKEVPLFAPGTVLMRLERVVAGTGAAASFYRALLEDPALRHRLLAGLDAGDLYAARLAAYPEVLDFLAGGALDRDAFHAAVVQAFDEAVATGRDIESTLDPFRRVKAIQEFKVLVEWLTARRLDLLNEKLSMIADCAVRAAASAVARRFPPPPEAADADAGWAVFALGKLGGRELTVYSDLDLVFLYAGDAGDPRCFERHQKFVRGVYDLLSKTTAAGFAYKLDTRLRPEGRMGALATPLGAFERYLVGRAEIWERMAWTRCRFIGGDAALAGQVQEAVGRFVYGPWSPEIPGYARHVRGRMERELTDEAAGGHLNLKRGRGGLADIDFLLQVLQLREGPDRPEFRVAGARRLLAAFPDTDFLRPGEVDALRGAYGFLRDLETVLRIATDGGGGVISTEPDTVESFAHRLREPTSGSGLLARYREVTTQVREIYETGMDRLMGASAS
jgi:glutamate-ammonia-ligase adenylyltransferase